MKRLATILMLAITLLVGGATIEAKTTTKGKAKAKTTQTSSNALWNGDMPTASLIVNNVWKWNEEFPKKGYIMIDGEVGDAWYKTGVCKVENWGGSGGGQTTVTVYNSSKLNQLYNDIKKAATKKGLEVKMDGNNIYIFY